MSRKVFGCLFFAVFSLVMVLIPGLMACEAGGNAAGTAGGDLCTGAIYRLSATPEPVFSPTSSPASPATLAETPTKTATQTATRMASKTPAGGLVLTATPTLPACLKQPGQMVKKSLPTGLLRYPLEYRVYLPPCYAEQTERRYPVLYLFHGQGFKDDQWDRIGVDERVRPVDCEPAQSLR